MQKMCTAYVVVGFIAFTENTCRIQCLFFRFGTFDFSVRCICIACLSFAFMLLLHLLCTCSSQAIWPVVACACVNFLVYVVHVAYFFYFVSFAFSLYICMPVCKDLALPAVYWVSSRDASLVSR